MAKQVKSFRISDDTMKNLEKLTAHFNEVNKVFSEKMGMDHQEVNNATAISMLINLKYSELKEQGYDL